MIFITNASCFWGNCSAIFCYLSWFRVIPVHLHNLWWRVIIGKNIHLYFFFHCEITFSNKVNVIKLLPLCYDSLSSDARDDFKLLSNFLENSFWYLLEFLNANHEVSPIRHQSFLMQINDSPHVFPAKRHTECISYSYRWIKPLFVFV